MFTPVLLPAAVSTVIGAALIVTAKARTESRKARFKTTGLRLEPMPLDADHADWSQAPVHGAPLLIRYHEAGGGVMEGVIHPKSIMGRKVASRGVRPDMINAFCQTGQKMRAFEVGKILWAADVLSGELVEDLSHYLGGAQPGGAPSPLYTQPGTPVTPGKTKRHW